MRNTSKKTAEIIIPGVDATPLPTFTPTPIPTNTPIPTEPPAENPETMLSTATSTPFVFTPALQPPAKSGGVPATFGDEPQTPLEPNNPNWLLGVAAAAALGTYVATSRKEQTFTLAEEKAEEATASDVVYGSAAAAAIGAYKAENEERMRREAAKRADRREKQARRDAEKAGRLDEYKRKKQEAKQAAARAEEERLRQKDDKKRAAKKREQSGLTGKELREKEAQQAIWDANGAAIYEANQKFEEANGFQMDAAAREQAIKDATRNGHFNATAYAGNLVKAATPPPPNPYAGAADRIRAAANEIEDEKKMGYQDAPLPKKPSYVVPDMSWKRDDIHAMEEYLDNKKEAAAWTDIEVMRAKWNHVVTPRPWTWQINNHFAVSIMPFDATPARPRPDFLKRLGTSLGVTGAAFDFVEAIQIFIPGPDEDATAFADLGVTLVSSFSLGETYLLERPHPDLPMMVAVNQDVLITAGDAFLALGAKGVGTAVGGPLGYAMGLGTDLITTGTSLPYDISRVFGTTPNYITAGISVSPETFGDVNIVVWPQK